MTCGIRHHLPSLQGEEEDGREEEVMDTRREDLELMEVCHNRRVLGIIVKRAAKRHDLDPVRRLKERGARRIVDHHVIGLLNIQELLRVAQGA